MVYSEENSSNPDHYEVEEWTVIESKADDRYVFVPMDEDKILEEEFIVTDQDVPVSLEEYQ